MNKAPTFGTIEYYKEGFSDTLCDIGDGGTNDSYKANCLHGLIEALKEWWEYHDRAAGRYEEFMQELYDLLEEVK